MRYENPHLYPKDAHIPLKGYPNKSLTFPGRPKGHKGATKPKFPDVIKTPKKSKHATVVEPTKKFECM
jgi:hypothetical protein